MFSMKTSEIVASHRWFRKVPAISVFDDDFYAEFSQTQLKQFSYVLEIFTQYLMFAFAAFATIGMLIADCGKFGQTKQAAALWPAAAAEALFPARITL
jgi:hypothetical protein